MDCTWTVCALLLRPTFVAAQVGGAPGVVAQEGVSAVYLGVLVGARVVRAEFLAALLWLTLVAFTLYAVGVVDRAVTVGAFDGVAVHRSHVVVVGFVVSCMGS